MCSNWTYDTCVDTLKALEWWEITSVDLDQGGRANPEFAEYD